MRLKWNPCSRQPSSFVVEIAEASTSGDGLIGAADVNPMFNVAIGAATGFAPYSLLDPVIVGDVANDVSVDGGDVATLKSFILHFSRPVIPTLPGLTGIVSLNAADPTLSLSADSPLSISVLVDHPQCAVAHMPRVVVVRKRKGVAAVQPAQFGASALVTLA